jgi:hypothetical protein
MTAKCHDHNREGHGERERCHETLLKCPIEIGLRVPRNVTLGELDEIRGRAHSSQTLHEVRADEAIVALHSSSLICSSVTSVLLSRTVVGAVHRPAAISS